MCDVEVFNALRDNGFEVVATIGKGGFSTCFKVFSNKYKDNFVCKVISISGEHSGMLKLSYHNELNTLCKVIHPNIIKIYKIFSAGQNLFQIIELCPEGDLCSRITRKGPFTDQIELLTYVDKILDALIYLEDNNIAHKDIKPSNILIDKYGNPKLADFGLSQSYDKDALSEEYWGTLPFLAPEILNTIPYNPFKSDIWSFGVTLYYLVTGEYPYIGRDKKGILANILSGTVVIPSKVNDGIKRIIRKALVYNPNERMSFSQMKSIVRAELVNEDNKNLFCKERRQRLSRRTSFASLSVTKRNRLSLIPSYSFDVFNIPKIE